MKKRLAEIAVFVPALAVAAGLFASPSNSASSGCPPPANWMLQLPGAHGCLVSLTATGPSPSRVSMPAGWRLVVFNTDSVSHTVVFANGLCSVSLRPGDARVLWGCNSNSVYAFYAGSYSYTVDGKFSGTVVTTAERRSVTLSARTHTIRGGSRLTLHGLVTLDARGESPPAPVIVLARHNSTQPFQPIATVRTRGSHQPMYGWKLSVRPNVTTTYIAEVTGQRLCYFPASRCAQPQGQFWANPKSSPFTVRIRH